MTSSHTHLPSSPPPHPQPLMHSSHSAPLERRSPPQRVPLPSHSREHFPLLTQIAIPPRSSLHRYPSPSLSPASSQCSVSPLSSTSTSSSTLSSPTPSSPHTFLPFHYSAAAASYASRYSHPPHPYDHPTSQKAPLRPHSPSSLVLPLTARMKRKADFEPSPSPPLNFCLSPISPSSAAFSFPSPSSKRHRATPSPVPSLTSISPRSLHPSYPPRPPQSPLRSLPSPPLPLLSPSLSPLSSPLCTPTVSPTPSPLIPLSPSIRRRHFLLAPIAIPSPPPSPLCFSSPASSSPLPSSFSSTFPALRQRYSVLRTINQSLFSSTKLAQTLPPLPPRLVCLKIARKSSNAQLKREADILQWIHREGRVEGVEELIEFTHDDEYEYLVTGLGEKGDLWSVMERSEGGRLEKERVQEVFAMTVEAVRRLHEERRVAHLDLSLENIVQETDGSISIIDYGSAVIHPAASPSPTLIHPLAISLSPPSLPSLSSYPCSPYSLSSPLPSKPSYSSPELTSHLPFDAFSADLFAMGVLLYILSTGHPPFTRASSGDVWYEAISSGRWLEAEVRGQEAAVYAAVDEEVLKLIGRLIKPEGDRAGLKEVMENSWVKEGRERVQRRAAAAAAEKEEKKLEVKEVQEKVD